MQLNGVGVEHNASMHHVTKCTHDHTVSHKEGGAGSSAASGAKMQNLQVEMQQEGQFSLSAWMEKVLGSGKRLAKSIWGSNEAAVSGTAGDKADGQQVVAYVREDSMGADGANQGDRHQDPSQTLHTPQIAAAATVVKEPHAAQNEPYFAAVEDTGRQQETLWEKVKVKFKDVTGQLAGHLPGKFFQFQAKNSFQAKQEQPKENLRKPNKLRRDTVEINSVAVEESYLLDSYDRKGGYSKLSTRK